jgi:hypothetical protein
MSIYQPTLIATKRKFNYEEEEKGIFAVQRLFPKLDIFLNPLNPPITSIKSVN